MPSRCLLSLLREQREWNDMLTMQNYSTMRPLFEGKKINKWKDDFTEDLTVWSKFHDQNCLRNKRPSSKTQKLELRLTVRTRGFMFLHGIFTWLADEEANVISKNWRVAVQEVACQLYHDRQLCQLLKDLSGLKIRETKASISPSLHTNSHFIRFSQNDHNRCAYPKFLILTATAAWKLVPQPITISRLQRLISFRWSFSPPRTTEETEHSCIS